MGQFLVQFISLGGSILSAIQQLHDLRHQAASNLINSGSSLYVVQQILGHSDPSVTQRYSHLSMKTLNEASDNASAIIKKATKVEPQEKEAA
ncbi:MAG TPA: tyrosine-type recombinase/integrase [Methylophilus sp.]